MAIAVQCLQAVATRKSVECSLTDPVGKEERWSSKGKEVGAARFHSDENGEWIDEECEENVRGAVNKELGGMEKKLKKKEFLSMEFKVLGVSNRVA